MKRKKRDKESTELVAEPKAGRYAKAVDFLLGNKEVGETVAVIGGGLTGCEIAYDLARKGKKPFIVEMADELIKSAGICAANSSCLKDYLRFYKVPVYLESSLKEIKDNGVIIQTADGIKEINCESVILSVGYTPNPLCEKSEHIHHSEHPFFLPSQ